MPKRTDIKRVLVIGSGPIVIGQACEFDYSGTQACKALRAEGLEVVLVNSNPATIMTDPELADRTYVEPLTADVLARVIERERPDALLPTVGGQTALNLAVELAENGTLEKYGVELIGAQVDAIKVAEDRLLVPRRDARDRPRHAAQRGRAHASTRRSRAVADARLPGDHPPVVHAGRRRRRHRLQHRGVPRDRRARPEPEPGPRDPGRAVGDRLEGIRARGHARRADNFVVICSIENIDPMGVHTGDSITVAPALTLTDKEYQRMRDAARRIIRRVGVETGGSNIQFAINPDDGRMIVIEMNPRVSRSSALASKATGFPIAKIAAKLALGYRLDEIPNDITRVTPASLRADHRLRRRQDPALGVREVPAGRRTLTTQMKSVGEAMAIGRTFKEAFLKAIRSLELGSRTSLFGQPRDEIDEELTALQRQLVIPNDRRMWAVFRALERGWTVEELHELTHIDPWFLTQFARARRDWRRRRGGVGARRSVAAICCARSSAPASATRDLADARRRPRPTVRDRGARGRASRRPTSASTPAPRSSSRSRRICTAPTTTSARRSRRRRKKVVILGSGPNRIGQGIEFDYCCCHAAFALRETASRR